jgi:hypothetical protein
VPALSKHLTLSLCNRILAHLLIYHEKDKTEVAYKQMHNQNLLLILGRNHRIHHQKIL